MSNTSDLARQLRTDAQYKHALEIMADDIDQWLRDEGLLGHDPFTHNIILGTGDYPTGREIIAHSVKKMNEAAARIEELETEVEAAFARGVNYAQEQARVEGRLVIVDSPELSDLRTRAESAEAKLETARNDALEEAAMACDDEADKCDDSAKWSGPGRYSNDCKAASYAMWDRAAAIRALKSTSQT